MTDPVVRYRSSDDTLRVEGADIGTPGGDGGSTLPVDDTTAVVRDPADTTKKVRIDAGAVSNSVTRAIIMGDRDVNLAAGGTFAEAAQGALADTALQPSDIASGAITPRTGAIDFSGGSDGHLLTVQGDGSLALEAAGAHTHTVSEITDAGALAALDTITADLIGNGQVEPRHIVGATGTPDSVVSTTASITLDDDTDFYSVTNGAVTTIEIVTPAVGRNVWVLNATGNTINLVDDATPTPNTIRSSVPNRHVVWFARIGGAWSFKAEFSTRLHTHAASDITSGTFADARIAESNVTQHQAALSITESQISDLGSYGDVFKVGTPADNQVGIWTGDGTLEGSAIITSDGTYLAIDNGVLFIKEQAEADADRAGYGQIWVDTATPNLLMFTDDAGTDFKLNGALAALDTVDTAQIDNVAVTEAKIATAAIGTQGEDATDYSSTPFTPSSGRWQIKHFTDANDQIVTFPAGLSLGSCGVFFAPAANTVDLRRVTDSGVSIDGVASNGALGDAFLIPAGGAAFWWVKATNSIVTFGDFSGAASVPDDLTVGGAVSGNGIVLLTRGAGSSQPGVADSGTYITTDGAITIPTTAIGSGFFHCTIEFGGDHNITFNGTTLDISAFGTGYASGDVVSVIVKSDSTIRVIGSEGVATESDFA